MNKMPMCRICLVENVRMYIVNDKDLQQLYEKLTDIPFVTEDRRPMLACFLCFDKLKQCCQLQRKCLEAEEQFAQMMDEPNLSVNGGQRKCTSGLIVTPVENTSTVDVGHIESHSLTAREELPAVCEKPDDVIDPKKEHLEYEIELDPLNDSCSDTEDTPAQQSDSEYDVPLIEIKTEVEEEQEVSRKKRRASDTTHNIQTDYRKGRKARLRLSARRKKRRGPKNVNRNQVAGAHIELSDNKNVNVDHDISSATLEVTTNKEADVELDAKA